MIRAHIASRHPSLGAIALFLVAAIVLTGGWSSANPESRSAAIATRMKQVEVEDLQLTVRAVLTNGAGKPRAVAEISHDRVLVLDSDWKRVSIHSVSTNQQVGTLGNGYGSDPGQFALPVDMVASDSIIHVFDYELKRVSQFAIEGRFLRDISITGAAGRTMAFQGGRYWFKLMNPRGGRMLGIAGMSGVVGEFTAPLDDHERRLFEAGIAGGITASTKGDLVVYVNGDASRLTWFRGTDAVRSVRLFPQAEVFDRARDGRKLPWVVATRSSGGVASIGDSLFAVLTGDREVPATTTTKMVDSPVLSVFDASGRLRGRTSIAGHGLAMGVSSGRHSGSIYVSFAASPAGKVVSFAVSRMSSGGATR